MDFDDDFGQRPPQSKAVLWCVRTGRRLERWLRWPSSFPPKIWLPEDLARTLPPCVAISRSVALLGGLAFVIACIVVLYRAWNSVCGAPLNAFLVVAAVLVASWTAALFVFIRLLTQVVRAVFLVLCAAVLSWCIVGIVWLSQASSNGCMSSSPMAFGLTAAFVIVYSAPAVLLAVYFAIQLVAVALIEKRVLSGMAAIIATGNRTARSPFLGASVLGDKAVGKTTLLRLLDKKSAQIFPPGWTSRIVDESASHFSVKANRITFCEDGSRARTTDLLNADCVVVVFSLADRRSFSAAKLMWVPHALSYTAVPIVLVGTVGTCQPKVVATRSAAIGAVFADLLIAGGDEKTGVASLSTSVLLRIFSFLPNADLCRVTETCRLWRDLGRHFYCWKDRSAGVVSDGEVREFMRLIAKSKVLKRSGFVQFGGYFKFDHNNESQVIAMWRRIVDLVQLNETKIVVSRDAGPSGGLQFSRFTMAQIQ